MGSLWILFGIVILTAFFVIAIRDRRAGVKTKWKPSKSDWAVFGTIGLYCVLFYLVDRWAGESSLGFFAGAGAVMAASFIAWEWKRRKQRSSPTSLHPLQRAPAPEKLAGNPTSKNPGIAPFKVLVGPSRTNGSVSRIVELEDGSGRVETWGPDG